MKHFYIGWKLLLEVHTINVCHTTMRRSKKTRMLKVVHESFEMPFKIVITPVIANLWLEIFPHQFTIAKASEIENDFAPEMRLNDVFNWRVDIRTK